MHTSVGSTLYYVAWIQVFGNTDPQFIPDSVTKKTRATLEFSLGNHDQKQQRNLLGVLEQEKYVRHSLIIFLH